jgi:hypothetical protein
VTLIRGDPQTLAACPRLFSSLFYARITPFSESVLEICACSERITGRSKGYLLGNDSNCVKRRTEPMKSLWKSLPFASFLLLVVLGACTSTKFSAVWKDDTYEGHPKKIMVISTLQNPANRRLFEDDLVKSLKDRGTDAVVSYTVMPDPAVSDKNVIALHAKDLDADTVLINKPLGTKTDETRSPFGVYEDLFINTQTDIYDMKSNRLILRATAETWIRQDVPYSIHIQSYTKDLVQKLSQKGLLKKGRNVN